MSSIQRCLAAALCLAAVLQAVPRAQAHPHVFAEGRMEIVGDPSAKLAAVRNIWRMDDLFSSSVVLDFDKNANGVLDDDELQAVGDTVKESIAEWQFYTFVTSAGKPVKMLPPESIRALFQDNQILLFFEMKAGEPIDLKTQGVTVANFDETFYVAFDFPDETSFDLVDMPAGCTRKMTVPDEDEAAQQWMASIADLPADATVPATGNDFAEALATKVEVKCG